MSGSNPDTGPSPEATGWAASAADPESEQLSVTYTVKTSSVPLAGGTTKGGGTYVSGTNALVTATPAAGFSFTDWLVEGTEVSTLASYSFPVKSSRSLVANFAVLPKFTINTSSDPSAAGTTRGGGTFVIGTTTVVTATPATGFSFTNWLADGTEVSTLASYSFPVNSNRSLVANFAATKFTIKTASSPLAGGTIEGGGTFVAGTTAQVVATPATGYSFTNWTNENGTVVSPLMSYRFEADSNRFLVANFAALPKFAISTSAFPSAGGTTEGGGTFLAGTPALLTATPATEYRFTNWMVDGQVVSTLARYEFTVEGDRSLVANFAVFVVVAEFTISTSSDPSAGGTTSGGGTFPAGTLAELEPIAAPGYRFNYWIKDGTRFSAVPNLEFWVVENCSFVASFAVVLTCSTSADPAAGGTIQVIGSLLLGTIVHVVATPATGYAFTSWTSDGRVVCDVADFTFRLDKDCSLVANFAALAEFTITAASVGGGGIIWKSDLLGRTTTFFAGTIVKLEALSGSESAFSHWTDDGMVVTNGEIFTVMVEGNRSITAYFVRGFEIFTSSSPLAGGTASVPTLLRRIPRVGPHARPLRTLDPRSTGQIIRPPERPKFPAGSVLSVTATPATGYRFTGWTVDGTLFANAACCEFTVEGTCSLVANFAVLPKFTISTSSFPSAGGTTAGGGTFFAGTATVLTATPAAGYRFNSWILDGVVFSTDASLQFVVNWNRSLVADFAAVRI